MSRKSRDEVGDPTKSPTRPYSLQGRDTSLWYTPKVGSGQNSRSRPDPTDSLFSRNTFEISLFLVKSSSIALVNDSSSRLAEG